MKPELTQERLRECLSYDPDTGHFTWHKRQFGRIRAGHLAGSPHPDGYVQIKIEGRLYLAHRLVWLHVYGEWPLAYLDHINGVRDDNRLINLRPATHSQNKANSRCRQDSKTGLKGVCFHKRIGKWYGHIRVAGKRVHLGYFNNPDAAHAAYREAAHKHFGKFARAE